MGYIGRQLSTGQYRKLDSIEGSFDGSAKGFNLEVDSTSVTPAAQNCLLSINGVIQEPFVAFSVTGSAINFAEAPESSDKFFGVIMGEAAFIAANTVGANELGVTAGTAEASKVLILNTDKGVNDIGSISGSATATASFSQILVGGSDGSNVFAVISGSGAAGTSGKVRISGSIQSTGSFGRVEADLIDPKGLPTGTMSGSAQTAINLPTGTVSASMGVSGSAVSTGSFGSAIFMGNVNIGTVTANVSASVHTTGSMANLTISGSVFPALGSHHDLGAATHRWHTLYVADLELSNERGDWTIIEEEEYLSIRNNKSNKMYKFVLEEIE